MIESIRSKEDRVLLLDQRVLPTEEVYNTYLTVEDLADAIRDLVVRGAPAIGITAAMALALGINKLEDETALDDSFRHYCSILQKTRPTARNLFWSIERMQRCFERNRNLPLTQIKRALVEEALFIHREDIAINVRLGKTGQTLLDNPSNVLTYCNTGALATGGYGTALGVIRAAVEANKEISVIACETRPFLQGARLTAWEMQKEGIPCTLITDNMAGHLMHSGKIDAVIVGADRVAANGDCANKIGTYSAAVLAHHHQIPFYVAAPLSTIDRKTGSGDDIPIEQRDPTEVTTIAGKRIAPEGITVANPAFDVTPGELVTAIVTESGIAYPPYTLAIQQLFEDIV